MTVSSKWNVAIGAVSLLTFAACGGGGGSDSPSGPGNRAPVAIAGSDQTVDEQTSVTLDGSNSTDADGNSLTYAWSQTGGVTVTLASPSAAQASFEAPNVGIGSSTALSFQLRVSDGTASNTDSIDIVVTGVSNSDPTVSAGSDQAATELTTVTLSGTASDDDIGDSLSYSWTQIAGTSASIADSNLAAASFTAPDVGVAGETLTFQLAVNDGTATVTDTVDVTVSEAAAAVTVSGKVFYEFVPPNDNCQGLDFSPSAIQVRPIRAATVQLIDGTTGNVLDSTIATDNGDYVFGNVAGGLDVRLRIRAELKRTGAPSWDVEVRDNVDTSASPLPLASRPLYVVDGANFNTGSADVSRDLTATTGWGGSSYTGVRAAAPFAILDAIYSGMQLVLSADASANFDPMDAFWSVNNTSTSPTDIDAGELPTSFYSGDVDSLFLLGDASVDTEEFDDHVSVHEWGHYFEDVFSRSDSKGGPHSIGQSSDARLAFGEGWATALAAMALDEPQYCDTFAVGTNSGFGIDVENNNSGLQGWFNEMSVATFLYDLWDTDADGTDNDSIGFRPIFDAMIGPQRNTDALTTLFSFATELRQSLNTAQRTFVDTQLQRENIEINTIDIWASDQGSIAASPNQARDVLPLYTAIPIDGSIVNICTNSDYDSGRDGNKLAEYRYLTFTTPPPARQYAITITTTTATPVTADPDDRDQSDPDMYIYLRGVEIARGISGTANVEEFTPTLSAGNYVADLREFRHADEDGAPSDYPEQICFDVSVSPL